MGGGRMRRALFLAGIALGASLGGGPAAIADDKLTFGTDWKAEAEHGGYYQAIATGIYKKYGIDLTLRPGGPQVNHSQLLAAGRLDLNQTPDSFGSMNFGRANIPMSAACS